MENQHRQIKGYRDLNQEEIDLMNEVKQHAELTRDLLNRVEKVVQSKLEEPSPEGHAPHSAVTHPLRWLAEGRTDLQKGYMSVVRSIAQPVTF